MPVHARCFPDSEAIEQAGSVFRIHPRRLMLPIRIAALIEYQQGTQPEEGYMNSFIESYV